MYDEVERGTQDAAGNEHEDGDAIFEAEEQNVLRLEFAMTASLRD